MINLIFILHYINSALIIILSSVLIYRSIVGIIHKKKYIQGNYKYSVYFLSTLYFQLFLGLFLFFAKNAGASGNLQLSITETSLRFWPVEHLSIMIFALLISHFGIIAVKQETGDFKKHKSTLIYTGIAMFLVVL